MLKINFILFFGFMCILGLAFVSSVQETNQKTVKSREKPTAFAKLSRFITFLF